MIFLETGAVEELNDRAIAKYNVNVHLISCMCSQKGEA